MAEEVIVDDDLPPWGPAQPAEECDDVVALARFSSIAEPESAEEPLAAGEHDMCGDSLLFATDSHCFCYQSTRATPHPLCWRPSDLCCHGAEPSLATRRRRCIIFCL